MWAERSPRWNPAGRFGSNMADLNFVVDMSSGPDAADEQHESDLSAAMAMSRESKEKEDMKNKKAEKALIQAAVQESVKEANAAMAEADREKEELEEVLETSVIEQSASADLDEMAEEDMNEALANDALTRTAAAVKDFEEKMDKITNHNTVLNYHNEKVLGKRKHSEKVMAHAASRNTKKSAGTEFLTEYVKKNVAQAQVIESSQEEGGAGVRPQDP